MTNSSTTCAKSAFHVDQVSFLFPFVPNSADAPAGSRPSALPVLITLGRGIRTWFQGYQKVAHQFTYECAEYHDSTKN